MAVTAGANPIQDATQVLRVAIEGGRFMISVGQTAAAKLSELTKMLKLEKAAKTLGEGGEMTAPQLKKLIDDVYGGKDTLKTLTLNVDEMDIFKHYAERNGLAYSTAGDYGTNNNIVCITYPGSQQALMDIVLEQARFDDRRKMISEVGTPEIMGTYEEMKDKTSAEIEEIVDAWNTQYLKNSDLVPTETQTKGGLAEQYLNTRAQTLGIKNPKNENGLNCGEASLWKHTVAKRRTDRFKDPTKFDDLLVQTKGKAFVEFDRSKLSFFTLKRAIELDPTNLIYFGANELKILKDYDDTHKDGIKFKNSSNSYFQWAKAALINNPDIFPYLQGGTMAHSVQHSFTLASIACLGGEVGVTDSKGEQCKFSGKGDPRMFQFVKLDQAELEALGKALIDKDPYFAMEVLQKCPTAAMYEYALEAFSKTENLKQFFTSKEMPDGSQKIIPNFWDKDGKLLRIFDEKQSTSARAQILYDTVERTGRNLVIEAQKTGFNSYHEPLTRKAKIRATGEIAWDNTKDAAKNTVDFVKDKGGKVIDAVAEKLAKDKGFDFEGFDTLKSEVIKDAGESR